MRSCSEYLKQLQLPVAAVLSESSNAMLSVWSEATGSAGSSMAPLLQSTANIHVIFVNLDWKRSRHDNEASIRRNTTKLADTASSIVTSMRPAVICCCEVGEASNPMTKGQMLVVADTIRRAWEASATEHPAISFLFEEGAPYLTIWDGHQCKCSHGRILEKVYDVLGHQRNAQAFLCTMPGESDEECIDVVNVHAPSGKKKLTDTQRYQLILNLLQSSSTARAGTRIGESKFLIGGDMNTTEICFSQILNKLRILDILMVHSQILFPMWAKPGDMCVVGGFTATVVLASARNHDHQHTPYGIAWQRQPQHATEQLTTMPQTQIPTVPEQLIPTPQKPIPIAPGTKKQSGATGSIATAVPEQLIPKQQPDTATTWSTTEQLQPEPQEVAVHPERHPSQLPLEKASASAWPATEQPDTRLSQLPLKKLHPTAWPATEQPEDPAETVTIQHRTDAGVVRTQADAEITQPITEQSQSDTEKPPTPKGPDEIGAAKPKTKVNPDADTETTRHATEQLPPDENEPPALNEPEQEIAYVIVNAFLDNVTFESTPAEALIKRIILTANTWPPNMLHNIDEVFRPIFFNYPKYPDRTLAEPRDASQYIRQWREIATWRNSGTWAHECFPWGSPLSAPQVQSIMHQYIDNFINNEANDAQRAESWNKNKSKAEARLRRLCGSTMMAKVIWQVDLPNVPDAVFATQKVLAELVPATEQQQRLGRDVIESITTATEVILKWLNTLATTIQSHKATPIYQEHARRSGTQKHQSGLSATELEVKKEKKHDAYLKYGR